MTLFLSASCGCIPIVPNIISSLFTISLTLEKLSIDVEIVNNFLIPDISFQQVEGELKTINFNSVLRQGTPRLKKKFNVNKFIRI